MGATIGETTHTLSEISKPNSVISGDERIQAATVGWKKANIGKKFGETFTAFDSVRNLFVNLFRIINSLLGFIATVGGAFAALSGLYLWIRRRKVKRATSH